VSNAIARSRILSLTAAAASLLTSLGLVAAGCSESATTVAPSNASAAHTHGLAAARPADDNGYIDGWFDGGDVRLFYTKSYFCAEPPSSAAPSNCEIGAPAEIAPREGPIPTIYAIAAAGGIQPPPATVSCLAGSTCLNHPGMIDLSRIGGPASAKPVSHSHILDRHGAGWFNTVNIRVFSLDAWNQIAEAKTLAKVRQLQGNNPSTGVPGVISGDTPTNIYFFIAGFRPGND